MKPRDISMVAHEDLSRACKSAQTVLTQVSTAAEEYSGKTAEVLFGVLGGLLGLLVGAGVAPILTVPTGLLVTASTGLGLSLGVLVHRGPRQIRFERLLQVNRKLEIELRRRIEELPDSAPSEVRELLWSEYMELTRGSGYVTQRFLYPAYSRRQSSQKLLTGSNEEDT